MEASMKQRLLELYARFAYVQKTGKNAHFKYRFFEESEMKRRLNEALRELRLCITDLDVEPFGTAEQNGKQCVVKIKLKIEDVDSDAFVVLRAVGGGMDSGDKAPAKAMVAAMKYALACGLSVQTGNDPEADDSTDKAGELERLVRLVTATDTKNGLEVLKAEVAALKGTPGYDGLVAAFRAKRAALQD